MEVKRIDVKEFREKGFLQEANRKFFHPLGLALEVIVDGETGDVCLGGVWDYRYDNEGMFFVSDTLSKDKADYVENLRKSKLEYRKKFNDDNTEVDENGVQCL